MNLGSVTRATLMCQRAGYGDVSHGIMFPYMAWCPALQELLVWQCVYGRGCAGMLQAYKAISAVALKQLHSWNGFHSCCTDLWGWFSCFSGPSPWICPSSHRSYGLYTGNAGKILWLVLCRWPDYMIIMDPSGLKIYDSNSDRTHVSNISRIWS